MYLALPHLGAWRSSDDLITRARAGHAPACVLAAAGVFASIATHPQARDLLEGACLLVADSPDHAYCMSFGVLKVRR